MTDPLPANTAVTSRYRVPLLLTLIAAGLAGNYFKFELFLNIYFLFGSIFALLALQFYGIGRGVAAAAVIAVCTYFLWNHPYAIIMTAEVAVVGWLMGHRKMGMVTADALYWLVVGMPLAFLFYHDAMNVPHSNFYIVMTILAINGIANALIARLIFTGYVIHSHTTLISYRENIYNLLTFFVICPALIMLAVECRTDVAETESRLRTSLNQDRERVSLSLESWVSDRKTAVIGKQPEWKLILEQPVAPYQKALYDKYTGKLILLYAVLLIALALAEFFSRMITATMNRLSQITRDIPYRSEPYSSINWPESGIQETSNLISNFREMSKSIQQHVDVLEYLNDSLEQRVEERTADLLEAKQFGEQIISSAQEGVIVYDRNLRYQVWNPFMEILTGMTAGEVLGRHPSELFPFLQTAGVIERLELVLSEGTLLNIDFPYVVPKTGNSGWASDQIGPLRNTKGEIVGVISIVQEITVRKQLDDELRQALENAKSANVTMNRLLRTVAHEFRTPLGLLTGSTDILDRYWDRLTPGKRLEQNELIRSAARQLADLINSVVSFKRQETDRTGNFPALLNISNVCSSIAAEVETVWSAGHTMSVTISADCGTALLDEILFRRILENLLSNAFRYTSPDGAVEMNVSRENSCLTLEIRDTGIGIPDEDQVSIFDAFYRSHNVEGRRGMGLGLSIVYESLSQIGGIITVSSRIGDGTTMRVEIPVDDTL